MSVKELYEWAVANGVENFPICVDAMFSDSEIGDGSVQCASVEVDENHFKYYFNAQETTPCIWLNATESEVIIESSGE